MSAPACARGKSPQVPWCPALPWGFSQSWVGLGQLARCPVPAPRRGQPLPSGPWGWGHPGAAPCAPLRCPHRCCSLWAKRPSGVKPARAGRPAVPGSGGIMARRHHSQPCWSPHPCAQWLSPDPPPRSENGMSQNHLPSSEDGPREYGTAQNPLPSGRGTAQNAPPLGGDGMVRTANDNGTA